MYNIFSSVFSKDEIEKNKFSMKLDYLFMLVVKIKRIVKINRLNILKCF